MHSRVGKLISDEQCTIIEIEIERYINRIKASACEFVNILNEFNPPALKMPAVKEPNYTYKEYNNEEHDKEGYYNKKEYDEYEEYHDYNEDDNNEKDYDAGVAEKDINRKKLL